MKSILQVLERLKKEANEMVHT